MYNFMQSFQNPGKTTRKALHMCKIKQFTISFLQQLAEKHTFVWKKKKLKTISNANY